MLPKARLPDLTAMLGITGLVLCGCTEVIVKDEERHEFTDGASHSILDSRIEFLEDKIREYPKRDDYEYGIAAIYFEKEDYRESARHLRRAISLSPDNSKYHYQLGRVYLKMREVDLAETSFQAASRQTPGGRYSGFHQALGLVKGMKREHAAAEVEFERAIEAEPDNAESYYFLAAVCDLQGKREKAVRNFREYLARGGQVFRTNTIFFLEKLGVVVDREALERGERSVQQLGPVRKG